MTAQLETVASLDSTDFNEDQTANDAIVFPQVSQKQLAKADVVDGLKKWRIWTMLAYQDIKLRYRRSVLGPFWLTLSMAITVYSMGYLYAHLFHVELRNYYPFLIAGMLTWALLSTIVTELTDGLVVSEALLKQIKLPYTLHIHRIVCRNMIIFFHNIIVIVPIMIIYYPSTKVTFATLLCLPGLFVIYINAISFGLILGMIGARFRDMSQVIKSLVQVIFFITPVLWAPSTLSEHSQYLINLNPFYAFIELVRAPLLGHAPTAINIAVVGIMTIIGMIISSRLLIRYRARIIYWL